jgi:subtilisin family serine protease
MSGVIAGIEWGKQHDYELLKMKMKLIQLIAVNDAKARQATQKSVISMSLGGPFFQTLNSAILAAVDANITVVVAAGNSNSDVAGFSPASASSAITVGAIDNYDKRASFSNFGAGVDIFAPGVGINSAWLGNTTRMLSGTSMGKSTTMLLGI